MGKDPVCGMLVDPQRAAGSLIHGGKRYYFCSPTCRAKFEKEPTRYASKDAGEKREKK
ncbi:MAG: YHS domain-containing protein [Candidatus Manganitrophaceae bacterium]